MRRAALVLAATAACSSSDSFVLRLDVPFTAEDRAAILIYEKAGAPSAAHAIELDDSGTFESLIEPHVEGETARVVVLAYDAPLADLGLTAGPLAIDAPAGRALPDPRASFEATIESTTASAWSNASDPTLDKLRALKIDARVPCPSFTTSTIVLPTLSHVKFLVRATANGVLVQTHSNELIYADDSGEATVIEGPLGTDGRPLPFFGGFYEENGGVWLGGDLGGVWSGTLGPAGCDARQNPCRVSFEEVSILTNADEVMVLAGPPRGKAKVLFAITERGSFERFDGSDRWLRIYDFVDTPGFAFRGAVVYLGENEAAGVEVNTESVIRFRDGEIESLALPQHPPPAGVTALAYVPGVGLIAGEQSGALSIGRARGSSWTTVSTSTTTAIAVAAIAEDAPGFAWVDDAGVVRFYSPSEGVCAERLQTITARHLARAGDDLVLAGANVITWLKRSAR